MNRTPDQAPESTHHMTRLHAGRAEALELAEQRRDRRRRVEPPRPATDRRWRFTDAVAAARQLSAGNASAG